MSEVFEADKIAREKPDPIEGSSTRWLAVPPLLLSFFLGFGVTYLSTQTESLQFREGDKRSPAQAVQASSAGVELDATSLAERGATIYKRNCQACHQDKGQGLGAAFPPLAGSEWVNGPPERLSAIVLYGVSGKMEVQGKVFQGAMPSFQGKLSAEELAAVATFVRSSWGNQSGSVSPSLVEKVEKGIVRDKPWKGQEELDQQSW